MNSELVMPSYCMCGIPAGEHNDYAEGHVYCDTDAHYFEQFANLKGDTRMNYSTAIMLLNDNIKAVKVIYESKENTSQSKYTFKTFDIDLEVGDLVIVPTDTRHKFTVVQIAEVDVQVDFESDVEIKWLAGTVDTSAYSDLIDKEKHMIEVMTESEKRKKREELKKNMMDLYENEGIDKLAITNMSA